MQRLRLSLWQCVAHCGCIWLWFCCESEESTSSNKMIGPSWTTALATEFGQVKHTEEGWFDTWKQHNMAMSSLEENEAAEAAAKIGPFFGAEKLRIFGVSGVRIRSPENLRWTAGISRFYSREDGIWIENAFVHFSGNWGIQISTSDAWFLLSAMCRAPQQDGQVQLMLLEHRTRRIWPVEIKHSQSRVNVNFVFQVFSAQNCFNMLQQKWRNWCQQQ